MNSQLTQLNACFRMLTSVSGSLSLVRSSVHLTADKSRWNQHESEHGLEVISLHIGYTCNTLAKYPKIETGNNTHLVSGVAIPHN